MEQEKEFTVERGIDIQSMQLKAWKSILKDEVYKALEDFATKGNDLAKCGYDISRGNTLDNFVANYMYGY